MESFKKQPFCINPDVLLKEYETNIENGLSSSEVYRRQKLYGLNEIKQKSGDSSSNFIFRSI